MGKVIKVEVVCPECKGTNNEQFRYPTTCPDCKGAKTIQARLTGRDALVYALGEAEWALRKDDRWRDPDAVVEHATRAAALAALRRWDDERQAA